MKLLLSSLSRHRRIRKNLLPALVGLGFLLEPFPTFASERDAQPTQKSVSFPDVKQKGQETLVVMWFFWHRFTEPVNPRAHLPCTTQLCPIGTKLWIVLSPDKKTACAVCSPN